MIKQAVILCGGRGERLGDITNEVPKPLVEVGGKPFVTYAINMLKGVGFTDIVLLVGYLMEKFTPVIGYKVRLITTKDNVNEAVLSIPRLQDLFLLLNGDCFPIMDWERFVDVNKPRIAMKIVDRDAGVAIVYKKDVSDERVDCGNIRICWKSMRITLY